MSDLPDISARLRRLNAYHAIFLENPNGIEMFEHLQSLFSHQHSVMYDAGGTHADLAFKLGQRSVIAYITKILNTNKDDITGENREGKADTDE